MPLTKVGDAVVDLHARAEGISEEIKKAIENGGESGSSSIKKSFSGVWAGIAKVGGAAALAGTTAVATGVAAMTKEAVAAYGQYEQLAGGIDTLFGSAAPKAMAYAEEAFKNAGMSTNAYMETAIQSAAAMISSLDGDVDTAAEKVNLSIIDMSDNVNKMGTTMEAVQNAYRGFSRGNFTMLDNLALGFAGTKQGMQDLLDRAQEISGIEYDIESYSDIVDAIHVVQQEMGITGTTQQEATDTIQGSLAMTKAAWQNLVIGIANENADMGKLFNDLLTSVFGANGGKGLLDDIIPRISAAFDGIISFIATAMPGLLDKVAIITEKYLPMLLSSLVNLISSLSSMAPEIVTIVVNVITMVLNSVNSQLPQLLSSLLQGALMLIIGIISNLPQLLSTVLTVISTVVDFILSDGLPMIIAVLPEIITGIVEFIMEFSIMLTDAVTQIMFAIISMAPEIITMLASVLPDIVAGVVTALLNNAPTLGQAILKLTIAALLILPAVIYEILSHIPEIFTAIVGGFKAQWPTMQEAGMNAFLESIKGMMSDPVMGGVIDAVGKFIAEAIMNLRDGFNQFKEAGQHVMDGLINGINDKISEVTQAVSNIANTVKNAFTSALDIHSPSGIFEEYGNFIDLGLAKGIVDDTGEVLDATDDMTRSLRNQFSATLLSPGYSRTPALAGASGYGESVGQNYGSITIPVYIGQKKIETIVVDALSSYNYVTGGR